MSEPLPVEHRPVIAAIVHDADPETMTLRFVRQELERRQELEAGACDAFKKALKKYVAGLLEAGPAADAPPPEDPRLASLRALGAAVRFGPALFKGLKDVDDDGKRCAAMKERFADRGYAFAGEAPTASEIRAFRAKKEKEDALDGIDAALIVTGKRKRAGVSYAEAPGADSDSGDAGAAAPPPASVDDDGEAEFV